MSLKNITFLAPKIEKETPSYSEEKSEETKPKSPPSYLERILSMTADIEQIKLPEDDEQETTEVGVSTDEYDGDLKTLEINDEGVEPVDEHSEILRQAKIEWLIPKDFGTFQVRWRNSASTKRQNNHIIKSYHN